MIRLASRTVIPDRTSFTARAISSARAREPRRVIFPRFRFSVIDLHVNAQATGAARAWVSHVGVEDVSLEDALGALGEVALGAAPDAANVNVEVERELHRAIVGGRRGDSER